MTYVVTIDRQNTDKIQKLIDNIAKSVTLQKFQKRIDNKRSKEIEEEEYLILVYLFHETLGEQIVLELQTLKMRKTFGKFVLSSLQRSVCSRYTL